MNITEGIYIFRADTGHEHHVGDEESSCFYFPAVSLTQFANNCLSGDEFGVNGRFARIEVTDCDDRALMHKHPGATFGIITTGYGRLLHNDGDAPLRPGDMFYVAPMTSHLSVADQNTTLIEHIVYLGKPSDRQHVI